jgi:hypothetical protein
MAFIWVNSHQTPVSSEWCHLDGLTYADTVRRMQIPLFQGLGCNRLIVRSTILQGRQDICTP